MTPSCGASSPCCPHPPTQPLTSTRTRARSQVIRCALENACSVAKTFLLADVVVTEIPQKQTAAAGAGPGAEDYGY